jgi:hypothetical protein
VKTVFHGPVDATSLSDGSALAACSTSELAAMKYLTPNICRCWMPSGMSSDPYGRPTIGSDGSGDSSAWLRKWNGVVVDDSKSSPSIESTQPFVQYGSSISASGVPKRFSSALYSHIARPQPYLRPTRLMSSTTARYSG